MLIEERVESGVPVLHLAGRLNATTAGTLEKALERQWKDGQYRIVLDCSGLSYVSSAGLGVFLVANKIAQAKGGRIVFASLSGFLGDIFAMTEVSRVFFVRRSIPEAVAECLNRQ